MAHLAVCQHQTPETRANAAVRRDARNRSKASSSATVKIETLEDPNAIDALNDSSFFDGQNGVDPIQKHVVPVEQVQRSSPIHSEG